MHGYSRAWVWRLFIWPVVVAAVWLWDHQFPTATWTCTKQSERAQLHKCIKSIMNFPQHKQRDRPLSARLPTLQTAQVNAWNVIWVSVETPVSLPWAPHDRYHVFSQVHLSHHQLFPRKGGKLREISWMGNHTRRSLLTCDAVACVWKRCTNKPTHPQLLRSSCAWRILTNRSFFTNTRTTAVLLVKVVIASAA